MIFFPVTVCAVILVHHETANDEEMSHMPCCSLLNDAYIDNSELEDNNCLNNSNICLLDIWHLMAMGEIVFMN